MQLTIRLLGAEVLHISTSPGQATEQATEAGTTASQVEFGFTGNQPRFTAPLTSDPATDREE